MSERASRLIVVGRVMGLYGVRGWLRVQSFTAERARLLEYSPWWVRGDEPRGGDWVPARVAAGRMHGKGLVAKLDLCATREEARRLVGADIAVAREQLPEPGPGEYYWVDLIGLEVVTREGEPLGRVQRLLATGSNDVLVVRGERERLIPFVPGEFVLGVDLDSGVIRVDWDPGF